MGEENWVQRQPGSVAGSVVPPPAAEITPPLTRRAVQPVPDQPSAQSERSPSQSGQRALPESLRALFKPVWSPSPSAAPAENSAQAEDQSPAGQKTKRVAAIRATVRRWLGLQLRRRAESGQRRVAGLVAVTIILLAAGGAAVALARQHAAGSDAPGTPGGAALAGVSNAAAVRSLTAAWISREIDRGAIIACDPVMCSALYKDGLPASSLLVLQPTSSDPLGAGVVVATPVVRAMIGSRLDSVYAPSVLASFGAGAMRVAVRVVAPDGAAAYQKALGGDVAARKVAGAQLLSNERVELPALATAQLAAGRVDPRLLIMLPVIAAQHPVRVMAFGDPAPGAGRGIPLCSAVLSASGRLAGMTDRSYLRWLLGFLRGQRAPYRAASITVQRPGGGPVVIVRFSRPSPIGLLGRG